jgi:hypothetical protein
MLSMIIPSMPTIGPSNPMRRSGFVSELCESLNRLGRLRDSLVPTQLSPIYSISDDTMYLLVTTGILG